MDYRSHSENTAAQLHPTASGHANADTISPIEIPHADTLLSHVSSLAYTHALQHIKCQGSDSARSAELEKMLTSLQNSFSLTAEQRAYLHHFFQNEKERKQSYIAERFTELEKNVVELAKARIKDGELSTIEQDPAAKAVSRLKDILQIADENIAEQISRKTNKLTENAFLIAVKNLGLHRIEHGVSAQLTIEDLSSLATRFEDFELSPAILEKATILYDRVLSSISS
jgi:hypothetical protein